MLGRNLVAHKLTDWSLNSNWILLLFALCFARSLFFFFPARFCFVFFTRPFGCCRSTYECIFSSTSHLVDFFSLLVQTFFFSEQLQKASSGWCLTQLSAKIYHLSRRTTQKEWKKFRRKSVAEISITKSRMWIRNFLLSRRSHPVEEVVVFVKYDVFEYGLESPRSSRGSITSSIIGWSRFDCPCNRFIQLSAINSATISKVSSSPTENRFSCSPIALFLSTWHLNLSICTFHRRQISEISHLLGICLSLTRTRRQAKWLVISCHNYFDLLPFNNASKHLQTMGSDIRSAN